MRVLLDQNVSANVASLLRDRAHDAVHAREVELAKAPDDIILQWCRGEKRTVVTMDADFHAILALTGAINPSVIRVRIESIPDGMLVALIEQIETSYGDELATGAAVTIKVSSIRVHRLPLLRAGDEL